MILRNVIFLKKKITYHEIIHYGAVGMKEII